MKRLLAALAALIAFGQAPARAEERYAFLVTIDGLRWQEVFRGADPELLTDPAWRARFIDVPDRRAALMPFLTSIARSGALIGDRDHGSCGEVTNRYWFSFPGYAEMLGGRPNPRITSNGKTRNDEVTALEWVNGRPGFEGKVRAISEWDRAPYILDVRRSGLPVYNPEESSPDHDGQVLAHARALLAGETPRLAWIGFGDTDNHAHEGDYPGVLAAAAQADTFLAELWAKVENDPMLRGKTTLLVTADHGRGDTAHGAWKSHGSGLYRGLWIPGVRRTGSNAVWFAAIGPDVAPGGGGAYAGGTCAKTAQVAATLVQSLGLDWRAFKAEAAPPLDLSR